MSDTVYYPLIVMFIVGMCFVGFIQHSVKETSDFQIQKTERVCDSKNNCRYLIFTDKEVLENTDSILSGKYNSSDFYNQLSQAAEKKQTCNLNLYGWRVPFLSWYRNIDKINSCK